MRGTTRKRADVTVFDPAKISDHPTYMQPYPYSTGVEYVLVNGKIVLARGQHSGVRPSVILYGPGHSAK